VNAVNYEYPLLDEEWTRLNVLFNKIGKPLTNYTNSTICQTSFVTCFEYKVLNLRLNGDGTQSLLASDFEGFLKLDFLQIINFNVGNQFLVDLKNTTIENLNCHNCKINQILPNPKKIYLYLDNNDFQGKYNLSSVLKFKSFHMTSNNFDDVEWINDVVTPPPFSWNHYYFGLSLYTNTFPNINTLQLFQLSLYLTPNFTYSQDVIENFNSSAIYFYGKGEAHFPFLSSLGINSNVKKEIYSIGVNWSLSHPLDLSSKPLTTLSFKGGGLIYTTNRNEFPFSKLPSTMDFLVMKGNYSNLDINVVRAVLSVDFSNNLVSQQLPDNITFDNLSDKLAWPYNMDNPSSEYFDSFLNIKNNSFYGTVPNWFCNLHMNFSFNQFSGNLPNCYACYLKDPVIRYKVIGNHFDNYNDQMTPSQYPLCDSIKISNIYLTTPDLAVYSRSKYNLFIVGEDFGVYSKVIGNIKNHNYNITFSTVRFNTIYSAPIGVLDFNAIKNSKMITITFLTPNVSIDISLEGLADKIIPYDSSFLLPFPNGNPPKPTKTPKPTDNSNETLEPTLPPTDDSNDSSLNVPNSATNSIHLFSKINYSTLFLLIIIFYLF